MEYPDKEVYFAIYCKDCQHEKKGEDESPCDECLAIPFEQWSHKPRYFVKKGE